MLKSNEMTFFYKKNCYVAINMTVAFNVKLN